MSNQTVGTVYQQIIRDVVDSSRVDFEEGGVDESVLDELSRVSASISVVPVIPFASQFHRIIISSVSNILGQRCENPDRRVRRSSSLWSCAVVAAVLPCGRWPLHRRGIQNQRGPSGIWSLLCSQGDGVSLGLARFPGAQPHMTWNTTAQPI